VPAKNGQRLRCAAEEGVEGGVSVAVGAFADPGFPPPRYSIYDCRRHSWVQLPPGTIAFDKDPD
jgi:hypothetical protein